MTTIQTEEEVETTSQVPTTSIEDDKTEVPSSTTSSESIDSTTPPAIVVTESDQLGFTEFTTNSPEEEIFTGNFDEIIYDDIENEISNDPVDGETLNI